MVKKERDGRREENEHERARSAGNGVQKGRMRRRCKKRKRREEKEGRKRPLVSLVSRDNYKEGRVGARNASQAEGKEWADGPSKAQ
jgi:hypothetical protein